MLRYIAMAGIAALCGAAAGQAPAVTAVAGFGATPARTVLLREASRRCAEARKAGIDLQVLPVRWAWCEPTDGKFDWTVTDALDAAARSAGVRWAARLEASGAGAVPGWLLRQADTPAYCLEHGRSGGFAAVYSRTVRLRSVRWVRAFAERYRHSALAGCIVTGPAENGALAFPTRADADTHAHPGCWAWGAAAQDRFQVWLMQRYGGGGPHRDAWGEEGPSLTQVKPFLRRDAPNPRAWLDQCHWLEDSLLGWAEDQLNALRNAAPTLARWILIDGVDTVERSACTPKTAALARQTLSGIWFSPHAQSFGGLLVRSRWVGGCASRMGIPVLFDAAALGSVSPADGAFLAAACSAEAVAGASASVGRISRQSHFAVDPISAVVAVVPQTEARLVGGDPLTGIAPLLDRMSIGFAAEDEIFDHRLPAGASMMIRWRGGISEADIWRAMVRWTSAGGRLILAGGIGRLTSVEGDEAPAGPLLSREKAGMRIAVVGVRGDSSAFREAVWEASKAVFGDGKEDGVWCLPLVGGDTLWLNRSSQQVRRMGRLLPSGSLVALPPSPAAPTPHH